MSLISYADLYIAAILNLMFIVIIIKKIFKAKLIKNQFKIFLTILITSLIITIINIFNKDIFKPFLTFPIFILCMYEIFEGKLEKNIVHFFIASIYMLLGEIVTGITFSLTKFQYDFIINNICGGTFGCMLVIIWTSVILQIKPLSNIFFKISEKKILNNKRTMLLLVTYLIFVSALVYNNSKTVDNFVNAIMNGIVYLVIIIIIFLEYYQILNSKKMEDNYNVLLTYIEKYEKEIVEKRKIIHDYKNQLIVINGYLDNKKKLKEYVKEIIKEQKNISNNEMIKNIDKLPSGIKGLVYYKLSQINEKTIINIEVNGPIDKFNNFDSKQTKDILKIIGILLDNAIEATIETVDKYIELSFDMQENEFDITILNSCKEKVDVSIMSNLEYSTKGKNRGYGLPMVKDILNNNRAFDLIQKYNDNVFTSKLIIKSQ